MEGATARKVFEAYLEHVVAPTLRPGQVVDNLSARKGRRIKEIIWVRGCEILYLPPCSLDFNPIKQAFSKVKELPRRAKAHLRIAARRDRLDTLCGVGLRRPGILRALRLQL